MFKLYLLTTVKSRETCTETTQNIDGTARKILRAKVILYEVEA